MKTEKSRGEGFFVAEETLPYKPRGELIGQMTDESCVAAVCRILLQQFGEDEPEAYLRNALSVDRLGAFLSRVPDVIENYQLSVTYIYRNDLTLEELKAATQKGFAAVNVGFVERGFHSLVIEGFEEEFVLIRDPLPPVRGSAYKVRLEIFIAAWLSEDTQRGIGVVII
jgi:ABC-type bacteriocin/lantibiotic exporter with double-glycine peptidase domain